MIYKAVIFATMLLLNTCLMSQTYSPPFPFQSDAENIFVATDENSHAIAAYSTISNEIHSYYYLNNNWNSLDMPPGEGSVAGLVMSSFGTAVLTYIEDGTNDLRSFFFNGSEWTVPSVDPLDTGIVDGGTLAMNADGTAAVVWSDASSIIQTSIFQGDWAPASSPGDVGYSPRIDININNDLVVAYETVPEVYANFYTGGSWTSQELINADGILSGVGIDDNDISIVIARSFAGIDDGIFASQYTSGTFDSTTELTQGFPDPINHRAPSFEMTPSGTGVVAWRYADFTNDIYELYYSQYIGGVWSSAEMFESGTEELVRPVVSVDTAGNALVMWSNRVTYDLWTGYLPFGGPMNTPEIVASASNEVDLYAVSLADDGFNALVWIEGFGDTEDIRPYGMASFLLPPPTGLRVKVCIDRFGDGQRSCVNILTWDYSADPNISSYDIYREGVYESTVAVNDPPAPQTYLSPNEDCGARVTYSVAAVNQDGVPGIRATITVN